jgi:hypothetical protein
MAAPISVMVGYTEKRGNKSLSIYRIRFPKYAEQFERYTRVVGVVASAHMKKFPCIPYISFQQEGEQ